MINNTIRFMNHKPPTKNTRWWPFLILITSCRSKKRIKFNRNKNNKKATPIIFPLSRRDFYSIELVAIHIGPVPLYSESWCQRRCLWWCLWKWDGTCQRVVEIICWFMLMQRFLCVIASITSAWIRPIDTTDLPKIEHEMLLSRWSLGGTYFDVFFVNAWRFVLLRS